MLPNNATECKHKCKNEQTPQLRTVPAKPQSFQIVKLAAQNPFKTKCFNDPQNKSDTQSHTSQFRTAARNKTTNGTRLSPGSGPLSAQESAYSRFSHKTENLMQSMRTE